MGGVDVDFFAFIESWENSLTWWASRKAAWQPLFWKLTKQDALNKKQQPPTPGESERLLQFKFLIQEKLDGY